MAAYAALNSVMFILQQIQHHPRPPITLEKQQMDSLCEIISFLQDFLEKHSRRDMGDGKEALESRITDAAYAAEDVIESHIADQILAEKSSDYNLFCQDLQKVEEDTNLIRKEVIEIQEKRKGIDDDQLPRNNISVSANIIGSSTVPPPKTKHYTNTTVGFGDVLIQIMDRLTGYPTNRQVLPIVGMVGTEARLFSSFGLRSWPSGQFSLSNILHDIIAIWTLIRVLKDLFGKELSGASEMELSRRTDGLGMELLNQSNYKVWRTCIESYLVGEDLWDVVNGNNTNAPANTVENAEALKKWRQLNAKAEFVLKRSISHSLFEHIIGCNSSKEIWDTLNRLFNRKDEARLQILENELANTTQGDFSIAEYFLKIKNLCSEISILNPEEAISEARQRRYIIRGLRAEYIPFVTSIQGWVQQPSLEEFENLLSSQATLAKQIAGISIKGGEGTALFTQKRNNYKGKNEQHQSFNKGNGSSESYKRQFKCYRCGGIGHKGKYCRAKLL